MDINSASPHEVAPLPFHGMKRYPYSSPESYPQTEAHLNYLERYNTRVVASPLPGLSGQKFARERSSRERQAPTRERQAPAWP